MSLVGQCTFGSSFLPPAPAILAFEFLRTIPRKNSRTQALAPHDGSRWARSSALVHF
jgi:hypothetical protein